MRVKLYAYFAGNLGDDLMVSLLLKRYPHIRFFTDSWEENNGFRRFPNFENMVALQERHGRLNHLLNLLHLGNRDWYIRRIRRSREESCQASVYIGGSVYTRRTPVVEEEKKLQNGPLFVIGSNFAGEAEEYRDYFRRCGGVVFRDRASFRQFSPLENVRLAPDVVLNFRPRIEESDGRVLISVMDLRSRPETARWAEDYENLLVGLCRVCDHPVLMSFCEQEGDEAAVARILRRLGPESRVEILRYRGDPRPILEAFARADRVVATRLHAMILAFCHHKPVYAISYDDKIKNIAEDMDFSAVCELSDLKSCTPEAVLSRCETLQNAEDWSRRAEGQFALLDGFLEGNDG